MKKKMVCYALFSVLGFGALVLPAHATTDEYAPTAEELSPGAMEEYVPSPDELEQGAMDDDGLPPNYEFEIEETDQPFLAEEAFPAEEGEGDMLGERQEDTQEMTGTSFQ